jgi:hypothetical protein
MPFRAMHQRDHVNSATSKGASGNRPSAGRARNRILRAPTRSASARARSISAALASRATTRRARGAYWKVRRPSPHPISMISRPLSDTKRSMIRNSIPGRG